MDIHTIRLRLLELLLDNNMTWYAQISNNTVTAVMYVVDGKDSDWCHREFGGEWLAASEQGTIRSQFPTVEFTYDDKYDVFYPSKPYSSWVLNHNTWNWEAPVPYPFDGKNYKWNEETQRWIEISR